MGLPAILLGIVTIGPLGTKNLQTIGFIFIGVCFVILAGLFYPLQVIPAFSLFALDLTCLVHQEHDGQALFAVYCLLLFSLSYGPNLTTFVLPAQTFSKKTRSTFNGLSAAMGKLGAFTGVYIFGPVAEASSYPVGGCARVYESSSILINLPSFSDGNLCGYFLSWRHRFTSWH